MKFTFDVQARFVIQIEAASEREARDDLEEQIDSEFAQTFSGSKLVDATYRVVSFTKA